MPGEKSRDFRLRPRASSGECRQVFDPFQHVGVSGEQLQQLMRGSQPDFFLAQVLELVVIDGAAHVRDEDAVIDIPDRVRKYPEFPLN